MFRKGIKLLDNLRQILKYGIEVTDTTEALVKHLEEDTARMAEAARKIKNMGGQDEETSSPDGQA